LHPWRVRPADEALAARLATEAGLRQLTARILVGRGLSDPAQVARFLAPRLGELRAPEGMADLETAVSRLVAAIQNREQLGVFGDYDVDGVTTAAVLTVGLRALGAEVICRAASRSSGYGLSPQDAGRFIEEGCRVVLTGDCGTSDHDSLALCRERGVDAIVIDHHQVPSGPTLAFALINSHRPDDRFPFKGLASCGVAFYLIAALRTRLRAVGHPKAAPFDPRTLLDLVAMGTLADLVPLVDENRILVTAGLRELASYRRPGLRALARIAELEPDVIPTTTEVTFRLTPRLNAAGRLGEAQLSLDLLLAADDAEGQRLAAQLDEVNRERQQIQERVWTEAFKEAEQHPDDAALVLGAEGWHQGVVGIIAAKLVEKFRRPAVVVGFKEGQGRGSARTLGGFNLFQALSTCGEHLGVFGGHAAAAGMSVGVERFPAFRQAFVAAAREHFSGITDSPTVEIDAEADLSDLDLGQAEELGRLAPFGVANAEPLLALVRVTASSTRVVGNDHLQLSLSSSSRLPGQTGNTGGGMDAIAFGMASRDPGQGASLHVIGTAEVDSYRGNRRTRFRVRHILQVTS
jgi:single-stranded-DNA-specific exonuclease